MKKKKIFKYLFLFCFFSFITLMLGIFCIFAYYNFNLPKHTKLEDYQPPITTRLYSNNGILLKEYAEEKRLFISITDVPDILKQAFISAEDKNFYRHKGIDPEALLAAITYNIYAYFKKEQFRGGSTITQQVVKNILLTNERTIQRKIKEAILSLRITKDFEKDKILELYLNHIFLGNNSYGIASAALNYFDKSLDDITIEEAALLASLPKAPGKLNPIVNPEKALARRNWVLKRMEADGYITKKQLTEAQTTKINLKINKKDEYFNYGAFVEETRKKLLNIYSEDILMKDGFVISTTIDPNIQKALDAAFKNGLEAYDKRHGYRGALGNIYTDNEKDFKNNWVEKLKNFEIKDYYRNNWQRAVVLDFDEENQKIIIGLLNKNNIKVENYDEIIEIEGSKVKKSYLSLNNIKWVIEPSLLNLTTINENGEEIKLDYKVETIKDVNLKIGDVIFVGTTLKNGYLLKQTPLVNGGAIVLDPHTGRVLAMVGGYIDSEMNFNRSTQAKRQPGSSIKPFIYLSAFENGYSPADTIMDEEIVLSQGLEKPSYRPRNFSNTYNGLVTLRLALQNSYNVSTVRLASQIGLNNVAEIIRRFEINKKPKKVYSVALGSIESYLINMVKGYSIIVNGGKYIDIESIEKIQDKHGKTIFKRDTRVCKKCLINNENIDINNIEVPFLDDNRKTITDPESAYQITSILEGVVKHGTAWRAKSIGKIIGGKTGTSNDFRDAWFIGFTPDIVLGVYVGFDDNRSLGENETGSKAALPIFIEAMKEILKDKPSIPFRIPSGIVLKRIDITTGKTPTLISLDKNIIMEAFKINGNSHKKNIINDESTEFNFEKDNDENINDDDENDENDNNPIEINQDNSESIHFNENTEQNIEESNNKNNENIEDFNNLIF